MKDTRTIDLTFYKRLGITDPHTVTVGTLRVSYDMDCDALTEDERTFVYGLVELVLSHEQDDDEPPETEHLDTARAKTVVH